MSDNSQAIVDVEVQEAAAQKLADDICAWLVQMGIIKAETSPGSTLDEGEGHEPGPRHAVALAGKPDRDWLATVENGGGGGVSLLVGRQVFDAGGNGIELKCPACNKVFEPGDNWGETVSEWFEGDDDAAFACPSCGKSQRLAEWRGPWPWGFGNLGIVFWNWPPLSESFVREVSERLGHKTVLVRCYL